VRAVVGLGNPGVAYAPTRHNAGFWVLERVLGSGSWRVRRYPWGEVARQGEALLLRPLTFVNRSGEAVASLCALHGIGPEELLVVLDDADLPSGELRLRPRGGAGGHRGMASIIATLGTEDIPRLRIGIGRPSTGGPLPGHVLEAPTGEEVERLTQAADRAALLAQVFLEAGLKDSLNRYAQGV